MRPTLRSLGYPIGELPTGRWNAITDVAGVLVGHTTLVFGEGPLQPGKGPVRTGVTVIRPHQENLFKDKLPAAVYTINGYGKATGFEQVRELGSLESPIALTNTLNVGRVWDSLVDLAVEENPEIGVTAGTVNIVVGETNDSYLNDIQGRHVHTEHVRQAYLSASTGAIEQGAVGAGTGTVCFGWKGGIGSASRILPENLGGFTLGALVQSNFGRPGDLIIAGVQAGKKIAHRKNSPPAPSSANRAIERGSVMIVLGTDAPVDIALLGRLCRRAPLGLARCGSYLGSQSGDFVIAFSSGNRPPPGEKENPPACSAHEHHHIYLDTLFRAVVEAVEEAVVNSLFCAETMVGRDQHTVEAIPVDDVLRLL